MIRSDLINYLEQSECIVVRNDRRGYTVMRNVLSGKMSGIPKDVELYPASVCRICKTLGVETPEEARLAQAIVDAAHKRHGIDGD